MPRIKTLVTYLVVSIALVGAAARTASAQEPYLGEIRYVGFTFDPVGWHQCDGSLIPINQNTALFSLLGTTYGGNGQTTFALPDMRGRVPVHTGQGPGLSNYVQGEEIGAETATLTINQMPAHNHTIQASSAEAAETSPSGHVLALKQRVPLYNPAPPDTTLAPTAVGLAGGNQPFSTLPPSLTVRCIIAMQGIYPARP